MLSLLLMMMNIMMVEVKCNGDYSYSDDEEDDVVWIFWLGLQVFCIFCIFYICHLWLRIISIISFFPIDVWWEQLHIMHSLLWKYGILFLIWIRSIFLFHSKDQREMFPFEYEWKSERPIFTSTNKQKNWPNKETHWLENKTRRNKTKQDETRQNKKQIA